MIRSWHLFCTLVLLLSASPAAGVLVNRYTFNAGNANDSVGSQHGTLVDPLGLGAYVGGQLDLSLANNGQLSNQGGGPGITSGAYIDLPNGIASSAITGGTAGAATFEAWITVSTNRNWARIFDFGTSNDGEDFSTGGNSTDAIFLSPQTDFGGIKRLGFGSTGFGSSTGVNVGTVNNPLSTGVQHHVAVTYDLNATTMDNPNGTVNLYLNGALATTGPINVNMLPLGLVNEDNDWLGRSQWPDALFDGSYNEFSIYNNALSATDVLNSFNAGPVPAPGPTMIVDRSTGNITIRNNTASAQNLASYSITSAASGLKISPSWDPIAPASGWSISSQTVSQLTESGGTAISLAANGGQVSLGTPWNKSPFEDLLFNFTLSGGGGSGLGAVQYIGNGAESFAFSDLNTDGVINTSDWALFLAGNATDLSGLGQVARYLKGDLNNDMENDHTDFLIFRADYIEANGLTAFNALIASVPEPSSAFIALSMVAGLSLVRRSSVRASKFIAFTLVVACSTAMTTSAEAAVRNRYSFTTNANDSVGGQNGTLAGNVAGAVFSGGQLDLSANTGEASNAIVNDTYVNLPNGIISAAATAGTSGAVTLEWWATASEGRAWQRLGDFGTSEGGEDVSDTSLYDGGRSIFVTTNDGRGPFFGLSAYTTADTSFSSAPGPNLGGVGNEIHVAAVFDQNDTFGGVNPNGTVSLYLDGAQVATQAIEPSLTLNTFSNNNNWLGRAAFPDAVFDGSFNEFRIHDNAINADQVSFNNIVGPNFVQTATDIFEIEVNKTTGEIKFLNNLNLGININYYKIGSDAGALSTAGWNSFDDKELGDPVGQGWDQSGGSDANELIEFVLATVGSAIAPNASLTLGSAYNTSIFGANNGDLTFEFGLPNGRVVSAPVSYVTGGVSGDFDGDGDVDGRDFLRWQRGGSPVPFSAIDLSAWQVNYGTGGLAALSTVPEPASLASLVSIALLLCGPRYGLRNWLL